MSERKEAWIRIIVLIISGIILKFWGIAVAISAILNWLVVIFSGRKNKSLTDFCNPWNNETYKYIRYLTFVSNTRPFPFSKSETIGKIDKKEFFK